VTATRGTGSGDDPAVDDHVLRPATTADLEACAGIWRESINHYTRPLGQPDIPDELGPILRLYAHLLATDPGRFVVAERTVAAERRIDAFGVATVRDDRWFLSMLFVRPAVQARGLGRRVLSAISPPDEWSGTRATATDSVQPISNGLYASFGMVPRIPLLRLVGMQPGPDAFPPLPAGVEAIGFDEVDGGANGLERSALLAELATLDRDASGFDRAADRPFLEREGRVGFLYRDGAGSAIGYGQAGESGRVGPVVAREESLLAPIVGHLLGAIRPRGAFALWVPGAAGGAMVALLRAGFRIDGFPCLLCWDRPFGDFSRNLPISPGLL
jgi:GNAT superfamily N-acetyltransferase